MSPLLLALILLILPAPSFADEKMPPDQVEQLARHYAALYGLPPGIVLRTVKRESRFDPEARNGPYWGLMQIRYDTAKGVGYKGTAQGLLDPATNLTYGVAYLANAYMIAGGNESRTHRLYRSGYYYEAKRKRMLAKLIKAPAIGEQPVMVAALTPPHPNAAVDVPLPAARPDDVAEADAPVSKTQGAAKLVVADATPDEPAPAANVPLPIAKPKIAVQSPPPADAPIVAKPKVVLASVLPEPRLSLGFGRETAPASAAAMAIAEEAAPDNAAEARAEGAPLPKPKPTLTAAADPQAAEATGPDFSASYFDIAVKILPPMPVPRPRPTVLADAQTAPTLLASVAAPRPKPRPVE